MIKILGTFIKKTLLSRKGITWIVTQCLIIKFFNDRILSEHDIALYDLGVLAILYIASLASLSIIAFEKIRIRYEKK